MPATPQQLMMAGPSFGSAVAVSQGAGELELGMSDFLGFGWAGFLGRGTAAPGRCITGGDAPRVGDVPRRPYLLVININFSLFQHRNI